MAQRPTGWTWTETDEPVSGSSQYCNGVMIAFSPWDFTLTFSKNVPVLTASIGAPEPGAQDPTVTQEFNVAQELIERIIFSPPHAKAFLHAMAENVAKYEEQHGVLPLLVQEPPSSSRPEGGDQ